MVNDKTKTDLNMFQNVFRLSCMLLLFMILNLLFNYIKTSYEYYYYSAIFLICYIALLVFAKHKYSYYDKKTKFILLLATVVLSILLFCYMYVR